MFHINQSAETYGSNFYKLGEKFSYNTSQVRENLILPFAATTSTLNSSTFNPAMSEEIANLMKKTENEFKLKKQEERLGKLKLQHCDTQLFSAYNSDPGLPVNTSFQKSALGDNKNGSFTGETPMVTTKRAGVDSEGKRLDDGELKESHEKLSQILESSLKHETSVRDQANLVSFGKPAGKDDLNGSKGSIEPKKTSKQSVKDKNSKQTSKKGENSRSKASNLSQKSGVLEFYDRQSKKSSQGKNSDCENGNLLKLKNYDENRGSQDSSGQSPKFSDPNSKQNHSQGSHQKSGSNSK
jgi:hypothetical protein